MATKKTAKKSNAKSTTKAANKKPVKKVVQEKQVTPVDDTSKKNKIIAIIIAIIIIIALLLCLTCCNKDTDPKKLQGKVIKESDKKKKKDKEKKETTNKEVVNNYFVPVTTKEVATTNTVTPMVFEPKTVKEEKDTTPAVITLNGDEHVEVEYLSGVYEEKGATYTDNKDGSGIIKEPYKIKLNGESVQKVDETIIGTYVLTYKYVDRAGNISIKVRIVDVKDTTLPTANAYGIKKDGKYVVTLSDVSEELSDWAEPFTNSYDEKVEKVTITDINNNPNEVTVTYESDAPEAKETLVEDNKYYKKYTFEVTDESDIEVVKIAQGDFEVTDFESDERQIGEVLDNSNNYEYTIYYNGTYTLYVKDALGNSKVYKITASNISDVTITDEDIENALIIGQKQTETTGIWPFRITTYSKNVTVNPNNDFEIDTMKVVTFREGVVLSPNQFYKTSIDLGIFGLASRPVSNINPAFGYVAEDSSDYIYDNYHYVYIKVRRTVGPKTAEREAIFEIRPSK
ncbi:MAG: DUF5011 domain-containing protein [Bacilli bacterium]|nr:DUF5011 domain-containing protein [Bacilli bacterium]